jgi:hypothetical protein
MLRLLNEGGIHSTAELARRLGVGEELVGAMTDDLARRGYLTSPEMGRATVCDGCALAGTCTTAGTPLLALTVKGRRAAQSSKREL